MLCARAIGGVANAARDRTAMARARRGTVVLLRITDACQCNGLRARRGWICQSCERRAADAHDAPGLEHDGAATPVEVDRGCVPVEDVPLHARAAALHGDGGDAAQKRLPDAAAPMGGLDEEVFKMHAGAAPGGVDGEVEGKAGGFTLVVCDE